MHLGLEVPKLHLVVGDTALGNAHILGAFDKTP